MSRIQNVVVIDAQGGGLGKQLITAIKKYLPYGPMFFDADTVTDHIPVFIDAVGREAVLAQDKVDGVPKVLQGVQESAVEVKDD